MFEGKLVRVRAIEPKDSTLYNAWMSRLDLAALAGTYVLPKVPDQPIREEQEKIMVIETIEDERLIGALIVTKMDWHNRSAELGAAMGDDDFRHRGYFKEAARMLLDHLFYQVGLNKIWGATKETNTNVLGLGQRYEAAREGHLPNWEFYRGRLIRGVVFSVTREDYDRYLRPMLVGDIPQQPRGGSSDA